MIVITNVSSLDFFRQYFEGLNLECLTEFQDYCIAYFEYQSKQIPIFHIPFSLDLENVSSSRFCIFIDKQKFVKITTKVKN